MAKTRTTDVADAPPDQSEVEALRARVAELEAQLPTPEPVRELDHTDVHGKDSIVSDEKSYHIKVSGQRYVHVGEAADGRWVYRPD